MTRAIARYGERTILGKGGEVRTKSQRTLGKEIRILPEEIPDARKLIAGNRSPGGERGFSKTLPRPRKGGTTEFGVEEKLSA